MLSILSLFASRWWAQDLKALATGPVSGLDEREWPLGRKLPRQEIPRISIPPREKASPLLSVMMPVYNVTRQDWLRASIEAVLLQDAGPEWAEIVMVDDASDSDAARQVAQEFGQRVRYVRNEQRRGLVDIHNQCVTLASGAFIQFLHQDDLVDPGFYQALLPRLSADPDLMAAFTSFRYIDDDSRELAVPALERETPGLLTNWLPRLAQEQRIQLVAIIVRRSAFGELGGFSPSSSFAFDWEMWGRIAHTGKLWYEPQRLARYRLHGSSATNQLKLLERLVDEMRVAACLLAAVPPSQFSEVAQAAFAKLCLDAWRSLLQSAAAIDAADMQQLINILLRSWLAPQEVEAVLQGLRLSRPQQGS